MVRYLFRKNPGILLYLLLAPLRALSAVAVAGALALAIDFANNGDLADVWNYVLVFGVYILLDLLIDAADQAVRLRITKKTMTALRSDVYHKLSHMCCERFFRRSSAEYLSNLTADAEVLRDSYFYIMLKMYADFLRCAVALGLLLWISPALGLFVLVTSLLQTTVPVLYANKLKRLGKAYSDAQERHMQALKENLSAFLTAKLFHMEGHLEARYARALEDAEESRRKSKFTKEWTSSLSYVFNQLAHLGVFLFGAVLVIQNRISVSEIVAASELIVYISYPILWLNGDLVELRTAAISAQKLQALLDEPEDRGGSQCLPQPTGTIALRDLTFGYGSRDILSHLTYTFEQGKKYLILGGSGSGKSTLLHLIAGLRGGYTGGIFLGDTEIRSLSRQSLTGNLCALQQEPFLFDDTLYHNICLDEAMDEAQVWQALERVELLPRVKAHPDGLHMHLGENAAALSGGEKQRVVIARALVRRTPVLLLDESTSHLDPVTAAEIETLVLGLDGVTVLLVSHNPTQTVLNRADAVLELSDGQLRQISSESSHGKNPLAMVQYKA